MSTKDEVIKKSVEAYRAMMNATTDLKVAVINGDLDDDDDFMMLANEATEAIISFIDFVQNNMRG